MRFKIPINFTHDMFTFNKNFFPVAFNRRTVFIFHNMTVFDKMSMWGFIFHTYLKLIFLIKIWSPAANSLQQITSFLSYPFYISLLHI